MFAFLFVLSVCSVNSEKIILARRWLYCKIRAPQAIVSGRREEKGVLKVDHPFTGMIAI